MLRRLMFSVAWLALISPAMGQEKYEFCRHGQGWGIVQGPETSHPMSESIE